MTACAWCIKATAKNFKDNTLNPTDEIKQIYKTYREDIDRRLDEFRLVFDNGSDEDVFCELAFCLFTPQSNARSCWAAVESLCEKGLLLNGKKSDIQNELRGVRFHYTKAKNLERARDLFTNLEGKLDIKSKISSFKDPFEARLWLSDNVLGMGMKEASHFLRNIGKGENLAILDRHIFRNLMEFGVIDEIPQSLTRDRYIKLENKTRKFAESVSIPLDVFDIVIWIRSKGEIFK